MFTPVHVHPDVLRIWGLSESHPFASVADRTWGKHPLPLKRSPLPEIRLVSSDIISVFQCENHELRAIGVRTFLIAMGSYTSKLLPILSKSDLPSSNRNEANSSWA